MGTEILDRRLIPHYLIPAQGTDAEIEAKKSVFIATVEHTPTVENAQAFVESVRDLYSDASHNAWAYRIEPGPQGTIGSSDDGEPGGTAGRPILAVLEGSGLCQVTAVVTRYFGGTKLGTGGLVRAYGGATREALKDLSIIDRVLHFVAQFTVDYGQYGTLKYQLPQHEVQVTDERFDDRAHLHVLVPHDRTSEIETMLQELSNGQIDTAAIWTGHRYLPRMTG